MHMVLIVGVRVSYGLKSVLYAAGSGFRCCGSGFMVLGYQSFRVLWFWP